MPFKEKTGEESPAQIKAFTDTWEWTQESERTFEREIVLNPETPANVKEMVSAFRQFIGSNAMMSYLVMMTPRLVELRRVLKPTGSSYLHCDPTASHYLKLLMDAVFGNKSFLNEIIWYYRGLGFLRVLAQDAMMFSCGMPSRQDVTISTPILLARIHRRTPMDGVRAAEGGG